MDLVNYLPLEFGQHSPLQVASCLKASNLSLFLQNWLTINNEIFKKAQTGWIYDYSPQGIGLKSLKRPKEKPISIGSKDSLNPLSQLVDKICTDKKSIQLIDATAGLLNDTHSLLRLGYPLTYFEANPLLSLLILVHNALKTKLPSKATFDFKPQSFDVNHLEQLRQQSDQSNQYIVVYYDPMFMTKNHKSLPSLEMQILAELEEQYPNTNMDVEQFQNWLNLSNVIIVKRPDKAPYYLNLNPKYSVRSKLIRFDVY